MKLKERTKVPLSNAIIGLGSNIQPEKNILTAIKLLEELTDVKKISSLWLTPAVGSDGPDFINSAVLIQTNLERKELKAKILNKIEKILGRVRTLDKFADRTIDLDILIFNDEVFDPEIWTQVHITVPVAEISPDLLLPSSNKTRS